MDTISEKLLHLFSYEQMTAKFVDFFPSLVASFFVILFFVIFWKIIDKLLKVSFKRIDLDTTIQSFIIQITKNVIFLIAIITALSQVGINTGSILASLGVAGLTIGFAAKDALSNIISGLFIFWDRPFVIGDLIEINGQYGKVEQITMRSTRVSTIDGKMIAIPNTQIVNSMVASYTNFPNLRIDIKFTVDVSENLENIREKLFEIVQDKEIYLAEPAPEIVLNDIKDFNIELIFRVWIKDEKKHIPIRFKLREQILDTLVKADVKMPFETINVILDKKAEIEK
ncbi:MAG: mechanosensitive ion channel family protein [Calditrichaeota bacterium]|nr:MAG: mechanosensitive ion channel family protein [Calditrichota bacterium]